MSTLDMPHLVASLALLVVAAHAAGGLAHRLSLPAVVGELVAGLAFGPTLLGAISPAMSAWITSPDGETGGALRAVGQLGVLLLMFAAGSELRTLVRRSDLRSVSWISASGVVVPAGLGALAMLVIDPGDYVGTAGHDGALRIVLVTALAVTSIPVISRIFADLGLLHTRLARMVLGIAVLEDLVLYVALSYAVSLVAGPQDPGWSLPHALHLDPSTWQGAVWHALASIGLLSLGMGLGRAQRAASRARANVVSSRSPVGWLLAVLFGCTLLASVLGLMPMLGALVAGITVAEAAGREQRVAIGQVNAVGAALFVPLYFVLTGAALDLRNDLDLVSVAALLVFGCLAKGIGVAIGARIAREPRHMARALVVSLNARGGPGIVLATTAFAAGIVDSRMFTSLLLLAVLTSIGAGAWLARVVLRSDHPPRGASQSTPERTRSSVMPEAARPTTIHLVRHGRTVLNRDVRYRGRLEVPLDDVGRSEAIVAGQAFASTPLGAVYSSPLGRALEVGTAIAASRGLGEVHRHEDLVNLDYGRWEGLTAAEAEDLDPSAWARYVAAPDVAVCPGGEALATAADRVIAAFIDIGARHPGEQVVAVTHGVMVRLAVLRVHDERLPDWQFRIPTGGSLAFTVTGSEIRLVSTVPGGTRSEQLTRSHDAARVAASVAV